ncbi:MAG: hypothetical protein AAF389_20475 [Gemmatimonadota bacterium]
MSEWLRQLRAVLGLGLAGAACGLLLGAVFVFALVVVEPAFLPPMPTMLIPTLGAMLGGLLGSGFAAGLLLTSRRKSLDQLSAGRGLLLGGAAGALTALLMAAATGFGPPGEDLLFFTGVFTTLGAGLGGGLMSIAKGSKRDELDAAGAAETLPAGPES